MLMQLLTILYLQMSLSRMLPNRPMAGGYREMVGINGRHLTFILSDDCQKVILEKVTFTSSDGDEGTRQTRRLELNMHHIATVVRNMDACQEGMECLINNEKIFGIVPLGDDIFALWDTAEMKQAPYTMTFRMLYSKSDGSLYADGTPRLLKSCSGVNCYGEEGKRILQLFIEALPIMQAPEEKPVKCLSIKRKVSQRIEDDDDADADAESETDESFDTVTKHNDVPTNMKKKQKTAVKAFSTSRSSRGNK